MTPFEIFIALFVKLPYSSVVGKKSIGSLTAADKQRLFAFLNNR